MDLISASLSKSVRRILEIFVAGLLIVASATVLVQSYKIVALYIASGTTSIAAWIPMWIPNAALLVGFGMILLAALLRLAVCIVRGAAE